MSRIMAIDYGLKRTGIAVTDPEQIIASGLETIPTKTLLEFLKDYISSENVECIVFGMPVKENGTDSEPAPYIRKTIEKCKKMFPAVKIDTEDERFTSKMAFQTMIDGGMKKKKRRDKAVVDKISATIILQNYLKHNNK